MIDTTPSAHRSSWLERRHPGDAVRVGLAALVLVACAAFVHHDRVGVHETDLFRLVNDLPAALFPFMWPVMQLGNLIAIPIVAAVVAMTRRYRLAVEILLAGIGVWLLAKEIKVLVPRGRPASLLNDVHIHGAAASGRGFLSGHAAVVAAIVTLIAPYVGRRTRRLVLLLVLTVCVARVYVGAHLPLDVIAGAALGWGAASAVHLLLGTPSGRPSRRGLTHALERLGFPVIDMRPVDLDRADSALLHVTTTGDRQLFVKVLPRERRDRDLLYRAWLSLTRRNRTPHRSPVAQADHEGLLATTAQAAGVRTPTVLSAGSYGNGAGLVVREWVDAQRLDEATLDDDVLADLTRNVATLQRAGITHGRLSPWTLLVDDERKGWIVGFDQGQLRAPPAALAADLTSFEEALATRVGAERAARVVASVIHPEPIPGGVGG